MALTWDKSLTVGVKSIDSQHQELFRQANALLEAMMKGQGKPEIERMLGFLARYVIDHFAGEEKLMAQYRYPATAAHKQQHLDFVKRFGELKGEFDRLGATGEIAIGLNRFVCGWLREHICTTDTALGRFLQQADARECSV